jgi:hypothetical protein
MSRGPQSFKQTDLTKAIKAAVKSGVQGRRVEIVHGKIIIAGGEPDGVSRDVPPDNDLDRELAEFEARHGQD